MRRSIGLPAFLIATALVVSGGCQGKADKSKLYLFNAIGYQLECDGQLKKTVIGEDTFLVTREPASIRVAKGRVQVGDRDFGPVKPGDKISVVGDKVTVNGSEKIPGG